MSAPTRRERRREARRREVIDAAMELVVREGIGALTIARLADEVDAAVGALYRYFPGKSALVVALQRRAVEAFDEMQAAAVEAVEVSSDPGEAALIRVRAAFAAYGEFRHREPALYGLIDRSLSDPEPFLADDEAMAVHASLTPILERCARLLDAAAEAGALRPGDAAVRTHVLWAGLHGVGQFRKRDRLVADELRSDALRDALLTAVIDGWRPVPA